MRRSCAARSSPSRPPGRACSRQAAGFSIAREARLEALDVTVVVLRSPEGISTRRALKQFRSADPEGSYDYNHLYLESGVAGSAEQPSGPAAASMPRIPRSTSAAVRVGLIDSGVDATHPVFATTTIVQEGVTASRLPALTARLWRH